MFIWNKLCLCHDGPTLLRFWFQTNRRCENSASYLKIQAEYTVQFLCCDWSKFHRWVHAENLCSILKLVYFDSWSWQSFVSACDVFNCLFPLDVQNEILLLSRSFKSLLFIGVLVEKYVAWQSQKSDFGWHRFRFSPCLMRIKEGSKFSSDSGITW